MNAKLYAVVSPDFGPRFAFKASNEKAAHSLMHKWNSHHSYRGADVEHTIEEIAEDQLSTLCISIHNEYIEFLA